MLAKVWSAATLGIDAVRITVEVDAVEHGQPKFIMVGLPDLAVREAYSRVRSALHNCGFWWPARRVTVNLSPADVKKEGSAFDLPIALGILQAMELLSGDNLRGRVFVGELSLDGAIAPVRGALSIAAAAARENIRELILPAANANEAAAVRSLRVIGVDHLPSLVKHLKGLQAVEPTTSATIAEPPPESADFAEVRGQAQAKRALEVAAAGGHNNPLGGPPRSRKTMPGAGGAVSRAASHARERGAGRRRHAAEAGGGEPRASRRALSRRAAGVPPRHARGAAPADGGRRGDDRARDAHGDVPVAFHARRRAEPVPVRLFQRRAA